MRRGEIWSAAGGGDYTGKPRPVVIVQSDDFAMLSSVTVCPITSTDIEAPLFRLAIEPTEQTGLVASSSIMVDKITSVRSSRIDTRIGRLRDEDVVRLNRAIAVFLGLAG